MSLRADTSSSSSSSQRKNASTGVESEDGHRRRRDGGFKNILPGKPSFSKRRKFFREDTSSPMPTEDPPFPVYISDAVCNVYTFSFKFKITQSRNNYLFYHILNFTIISWFKLFLTCPYNYWWWLGFQRAGIWCYNGQGKIFFSLVMFMYSLSSLCILLNKIIHYINFYHKMSFTH